MSTPVLVVGTGGGVGRAVAQRLLEDGRTVIGTVRSEAHFAEMRHALPGLSALFALDLGDADAIQSTLRSQLGDTELAAVIVCAAQCRYGPLETESLVDARRLMEVNAFSNLAIYQVCLPALRRSAGTLVLLSSNSGVVSMPFLGTYQASKFALEALADVMRMEASKWGVRVVLVEPGGMDTAMSRRLAQRIPADIERLSAEEAAHYHNLYCGFRNIVANAQGATPVGDVAKLIAEIVESRDPEPRYPIGDDTALLLRKRTECSDREMDAFAKSLYGWP